MPNKRDGNQDPHNTKVLQLGFNISVSGDPGTDFQIVLDEKGQALGHPSTQEVQIQGLPQLEDSECKSTKQEVESNTNMLKVEQSEATETICKQDSQLRDTVLRKSSTMNENEKQSSSSSDLSIINEIKTTMEHFEKFSDHIKEIPRLRSQPIATSTPFLDKQNSKSESSLVYSEYRPKRFKNLYDFHLRKDYFRGSEKPKPPDLFLKPLPGENLYRQGIVNRYFDLDSFRHYGSVCSLGKLGTESKYETEKYEFDNATYEGLPGILKKTDYESGDKQSTSSADSVKDIKIYQSGGILIMQNFKDNLDTNERKEISKFSAQLIENCNKLKEEVNIEYPDNDKKMIGSSSEECKNSGKMVQFDLSGSENRKSKSEDSLSIKMESSGSTNEGIKMKDFSPQGTSQSQDFPSISTQENDSVISNQPGTSPTYGANRKLEWDSGADVGYLNLDLSKENLSTIERIVLKGLSSDGLSEKNVVFEKKPEQTNSKFILERMPSDSVFVEITENKSEEKIKKISEVSQNLKKNGVDEKKTKKTIAGVVAEDVRKDEKRELFEEVQSTKKITGNQLSKELKPIKKTVESTDKSVNVNTLFKDSDNQSIRTEDYRIIESPKFRSSRVSPKIKKLRKKRPSSCRTNLTAPLKEKIKTIIDIARCSARSNEGPSCEVGIPKKIHKQVESNPKLNEVELPKEVEEIIIDQQFKIKENVTASREMRKKEPECKKEKNSKGKPVSASSSSINTVLQNNEGKEENEINMEQSKFADQIIQTKQSEVESIGIQAFASQASSVCDFKVTQKQMGEEVAKVTRVESINTSSKNIQAFGLNSSLPKQLAHPKGTEVPDSQNTKSTQFFGGPINSLPNYHSNLITKPKESCGRLPKVLKAKKNLEAEIIRLKEENQKNILANDESFKEAKPEPECTRRSNNKENKENLITQKSTNSKRSRNSASLKGSKDNDVNLDFLRISQNQTVEKDKQSIETSECFPLSDVSSKVLTSEVLREYGDSIDRNIIQEKYFQSQLIEFERRKMISKSTSMDAIYNVDRNTRTSVTVGCQYSPLSRDNESDREFKSQKQQDAVGKDWKVVTTSTSEQYNSGEHLTKDERGGTLKSGSQEQNFETGDSLPSSAHTAHSWIPGNHDSEENNTNGIGRAKSFEYLPGHIYEDNENLKELHSDVEQNLIACSSSGSSNSSVPIKRSGSDKHRNSEGRSTLILENSTESSFDSGPVKILDDNLTQLNLVVSKLWKKDAQVQNITRSLLINLWEKNGSGDCCRDLAVMSDSSKAEGVDTKNAVSSCENKKGRGDASEVDFDNARKKTKENEISIGCQTEKKSPFSDSEKIYEERKALEKRISEEKQSQIKWIENEINHLNILRGLLEKQNYSSERRKKLSVTSLPKNETPRNEEKYEKNIVAEVYPKPVTPVYGCTISVLENQTQKNNHSSLEPENSPCTPEENENHCSATKEVQYGMSVSLTGEPKNLRKVIMFPVGVQVSIKNDNAECEEDDAADDSNIGTRQFSRFLKVQKPCLPERVTHSDVGTQYPSFRRNFEDFPSTSAQTDFPTEYKCASCGMENCVCLDLSEKSCESPSRLSRSKSRGSEKRDSLKLDFAENKDFNESKFTCDSVDAVTKEIGSYSPPMNNRNPEKRSPNDSDLSGTLSGSKTTQSQYIRCEACQKKKISKDSKSGIVCRERCQSNIYLNCEKSENFGSNRHSKIQVQKSSSCVCHVIRIHGPKCCSSESGTCSCRKRTPVKKTENQSCQTDDVTIIRKDLIENAEIVNVTKGPGIIHPAEQKIAMETKKPIDEKYPFDPKVSYEKKHPCVSKLEVKQKCGLERLRSDENVAVKVKTPVPVTECHCKKKPSKEKSKVDEHPRHYFLKIEETEIDESCESIERRKSLEVITVTVPVKRAGKSKIYGKKIQQPYESNSCSIESFRDYLEKDCKCCEECLHRLCEKLTQHPCTYREFQKTQAEKPQSPKRPSKPQPTESDSYEDVEKYERDSCRHKAFNRQSSSSVECYPDKNYIEYEQSGSFCFEKHDNESSKAWTENCGCSKANEPSDYNSHKECRNGRHYYEEGKNKPYEDDREYVRRQKMSRSHISQYERGRETNSPSNYDSYNPDYYDYNKREFLTKSELMKEKDFKKKVHQPTLQECLASNRPDFFSSAENRRRILSERAKERSQKHTNRMECLMNLIHHCNESEHSKNKTAGPKRIFTTSQMKEQTMKRYKKLPEVTGKIADQKKKEEYKTNKLMADIFAKKLQLEALKGHINLSNSVSVLSTI